MKCLVSILSLPLIAVMFSGCACYYGYRDYEETKPLKKGEESLNLETHDIVKEDGKLFVKEFKRYKYTQNYRKYFVREWVYSEFENNAAFVIAHIITYPLSLTFSPFAFLMPDETKDVNDNSYIYTRWRRGWNFINPLTLMVSEKHYKFERNVVSYTDTSRVEYREERGIAFGASLDVTLGDGRKLIEPGGIDEERLRKDVFDYPLPERTENIEIAYRDARMNLTLSSVDSITKEQRQRWNDYLQANDAENYKRQHEFERLLNGFFEKKIISKKTYDAELKRMKGLVRREEHRLAEEKRREEENRIKKAQRTYRYLKPSFDRLFELSQKTQKWTNAEQEEVLKHSRILLVWSDGESILKLLFDKGLIDDVNYQKNRSSIDCAANYMGWYYLKGEDTGKDFTLAAKLFSKAAEHDYAAAQLGLGLCYSHGWGVDKNQIEAVRLWNKAAEQGNAEAQLLLGNCCYSGNGVEKNLKQAVEWYRKSADQGNAGAQDHLAVCYQYGMGISKNMTKAIELYRKAAEQGNAEAQLHFANCCNNGWGVKKDHAEAVKWYHKSAEQGNAVAQEVLGDCYYHGNGVGKDFAEAVKWFSKSADQGNAAAQYSLGWCFQYGQGVPTDMTKAVALYRKAAAQGYQPAAKKLEDPWLKLVAEGVFGVRFGDRFYGEKKYLGEGLKIRKYKRIDLSNSNHYYHKGNWDKIYVDITQKTHLIYRITASKDCENSEAADAECKRLISLFEKKYKVNTKSTLFTEGVCVQNGFRVEIKSTWHGTLQITYTNLSLERLAEKEYASNVDTSEI